MQDRDVRTWQGGLYENRNYFAYFGFNSLGCDDEGRDGKPRCDRSRSGTHGAADAFNRVERLVQERKPLGDAVADVEDARKILRIVDALEDNDDVQDVYTNLDVDDTLLAKLD